MSLLTGMLQLLPPETAHNVTIQLTKYGSPLLSKGFQDQSLHTNVKGLSFSNPLGIAAGFDKNAELIDPLLKIDLDLWNVELLHRSHNMETQSQEFLD